MSPLKKRKKFGIYVSNAVYWLNLKTVEVLNQILQISRTVYLRFDLNCPRI